jgi:DNA mismatch repair protein MutS2
VIELRQGITAELLSSDELRGRVAGLVGRLEQMFALLEAGGVGVRLDSTRRSLDVLSALKGIVDECQHFASATSALSRLSDWSQQVKGTAPYDKLCRLLEYDERQANVVVDLRLGRGGELRGMHVLSVRENNPLKLTPWRRMLGRLSLLFRGLRLKQEEVYGRLIHDVFEGLVDLFPAVLQVLAELEFYRLGISLANFAREQGLAVCLPTFDAESRSITKLFNPFLLLEERPPRPCDLTTLGAGSVVVITGPNSGGKTRLVQAWGICQVLAQAGLCVPAASACVPWQQGLFASLSATPGAQEREGRLGTELLRIRRMFEKLEVGALVLVDELCSGTNPAEAEQLFEMVIGLLGELSAHAFVTTHFLKYAARLQRERPFERLEFLCVELDDQNHPTYGFREGVAETALAQQTATRLGVTRDELLQLVRRARERDVAPGQFAERGQY